MLSSGGWFVGRAARPLGVDGGEVLGGNKPDSIRTLLRSDRSAPAHPQPNIEEGRVLNVTPS